MAFKYTLSLPPLGAADVEQRELHTSVGGNERPVETVPANTTGVVRTFAQDDNVEFWVVDIDEAGNKSANGEILAFVATDTIAPNAPIAATIVSVEEVDDAPPTP